MNLIEVIHTRHSNAILKYYDEFPNSLRFQIPAYVGKNGIGKRCEGDMKTPTGHFHLTMAFGMHELTNTLLKYVKINEKHYWSDSPINYNQLIETSSNDGKCPGEHLIEFPEAYEFALAIDYNRECIVGLGTAIFLHCIVPGHHYTAGCIAIDRQYMYQLLQLCDEQTELLIH